MQKRIKLFKKAFFCVFFNFYDFSLKDHILDFKISKEEFDIFMGKKMIWK